MRLRRFILTCLSLLAWTLPAEAQTDVFPNLWITDSRVEGMAILGDTVFVAGRFDYVGPPTGQLAVLDAQTGEADLSQPRFSALGTSGILVALPDGTGGYYVGGAFSVVAGQSRRNLARVLPDGTLDPDFRPDPMTAAGFGAVSALAIDGGTLYVGGEFAIIGGQPRDAVAALDASTGTVLPFDAALSAPEGAVFGVLNILVRDGVVYTGGDFQTIAGQPRPLAVALDGITGALLPWGATATGDGSAFPVAGSDGTVYLYGDFTMVNGQPRPFLAEVTLYDPATGGGALTPWAPETSVFGDDFALTPTSLWAVSYTQGLRRISRASGAVATGSPGCSRGRALAYRPGANSDEAGTLFLGCERPMGVSGEYFPHVVRLDAETGQPSSFSIFGASAGNIVASLAVESGPGGHLFVGGDFVTFGAGIQRRNGLATFDLTTGRPTDFGTGDFPFTEDLALSPDGLFLYALSNTVGGLRLTEFDLAAGTTRAFIPGGRRPEPTAMTAPPSARPRLVANLRVENAASALVVTDDGAGGGRVCLSSRGVACYDRASTNLLFYTPMPSVTAQAENNGDLLYLPPGGPVAGPGGAEGTLYVAAPIEEAPAGTRRPAFVAVDYATGAVLPSWDVGFGPTGGPEGYTLALLDRDGADGPAPATLYLGGDRQWTVQGQPRQELMAVDPTTATLQPWAPVVSGGAVFTMAAQRSPGGQGVVYAGGAFRFINGTIIPTSAVAFDAATGTYLPGWTPGTGIAFVSLVSEQHDAVFVGGLVGLPGTGHEHLVAVTPARPLLPTAGESGVAEAPRQASLALAGPNPLRSRTALAVSLPEAQAVDASLYDVLGRRVAALHTGVLPAGVSRIAVDASALPAGVYVARVVAGTFTEALTLTVVR